MPNLAAIAPIIWAKWGGIWLESLRQDAQEAADGLAFRAMNSDGGIRTLLIVCTTDRARIGAVEEALALRPPARPADWETYGGGGDDLQDGEGGRPRPSGTA